MAGIISSVSGGVAAVDFRLNGVYSSLTTPYTGVDGLYIIPVKATIVNVFVYSLTQGSSGTTQVDVKLKPYNSGSFTSIFSTLPSVSSTAAANTWLGIGDTQTGCVAPVLSTTAVTAKSALRFDIQSTMGGSPANFGVLIQLK